MAKIWVLVADSAVARVFATSALVGPLEEIDTLTHPEARLHEQELVSDLPGRAFDIAGKGRHAMEPPVSPKEQAATRFAGEVAARLERGRTDGAYERLVLVAAPRFLGLLRDKLSAPTRTLVRLEIDKNMARQDASEIRKLLQEHA